MVDCLVLRDIYARVINSLNAQWEKTGLIEETIVKSCQDSFTIEFDPLARGPGEPDSTFLKCLNHEIISKLHQEPHKIDAKNTGEKARATLGITSPPG
ncbi:MAG: hypothetical protein A2Z71_11590 [Chloroflexi bacterium RBG_13_50_21]|nr:MAG: hypothetical protein A2Z71_11590 [Chloroflexi bacterium RBG_13_50_21]